MDLDAIDSHIQDVGDVGNVQVDRTTIHLLSKHGKLNANELKVAYKKAHIYPSKAEWLEHSYRFFMAAGVLLFMSGIVFFFAYNWEGLHHFAKLGLVEGGILLIGLGLLFLKPSDFILKLGLTIMSVLVGVSFAVFGQIYQTGADAYDFFLGWTIFVTAWVAISSFPFLWLFYLGLINITTVLYFDQVLGYEYAGDAFLVLILFNSMALVAWEYHIKGSRLDWVHSLCIRIIGVGIMWFLTMQVMGSIFGSYRGYGAIYGVVYIAWMLIGGYFYTQKIKDIAFTAMFSISLLVVVNSLIVQMFDTNWSNSGELFFILSILNIGATVGLVMVLISLNKKWIAEEEYTATNQLENDLNSDTDE